MILFTTGYHTPFVRLFEAAEKLASETSEEIIVQGRECDFPFEKCHYKPFIKDLKTVMESASVVVTHGAMSLTEAIKFNGRIVVCPRRHKYNEHINDHQVEFAHWIKEQYNIPVVLEMEDLESAIDDVKNSDKIIYDSTQNIKLADNLKNLLSKWAR